MSRPPSYTRLNPAERRDQILDAANVLFAERGYEEVTIEDIATSAGVTRGLVHHYFGGRKDVYIALLERVGAGREERAAAARRSHRSRASGGHGLTLAGVDTGQPNDLSRHDRTR